MNSKSNLLTVIALVLGIISIPLSCLYAWVGIVCGIIGLILSVISGRYEKTGMTLAALICSIIGIVLGAASMIIVGAFLWMALS